MGKLLDRIDYNNTGHLSLSTRTGEKLLCQGERRGGSHLILGRCKLGRTWHRRRTNSVSHASVRRARKMVAGRSACYSAAAEPEAVEPAIGGWALELCRRSSPLESASRTPEGSTHRFPQCISARKCMPCLLKIRKLCHPIARGGGDIDTERYPSATFQAAQAQNAAAAAVAAPRGVR
jgi:hypothetical protein